MAGLRAYFPTRLKFQVKVQGECRVEKSHTTSVGTGFPESHLNHLRNEKLIEPIVNLQMPCDLCAVHFTNTQN